MFELGLITADFISTIVFQCALPIGILTWKWMRIRANRTVDYTKVKRASLASQMRSNYV